MDSSPPQALTLAVIGAALLPVIIEIIKTVVGRSKLRVETDESLRSKEPERLQKLLDTLSSDGRRLREQMDEEQQRFDRERAQIVRQKDDCCRQLEDLRLRANDAEDRAMQCERAVREMRHYAKNLQQKVWALQRRMGVSEADWSDIGETPPELRTPPPGRSPAPPQAPTPPSKKNRSNDDESTD